MAEQPEEQTLERRIRERAYRLWEEEGRPEGRDDAHWEMAATLIAIEDNPQAGRAENPEVVDPGLGPTGEPVEPKEAITNQGDVPNLTDQGRDQSPAFPAAAKKPGSRRRQS
jgi:hypothetical protein